MEGLRRPHGVLPGHGVHHEERLAGLDGLLDSGDFVHHVLVHRQTAGGVDDDDIVAVAPGMPHGGFGNGHWVFLFP